MLYLTVCTPGIEVDRQKLVTLPLKDPSPPWIFCTVFVQKIILSNVQFLQGQFMTKKLSVPRGNFSNYFMKIISFSLLYCSKSATLEIAYNIKNRFLVMYSLISPQTTDWKNNVYVHLNGILSNPKWICLNWNKL